MHPLFFIQLKINFRSCWNRSFTKLSTPSSTIVSLA